MNIILLGYRGSGKTTIGKKLALQLHMDFVDLDDRVRAAFDGLTIADIWQRHGEPAFRAAETICCRQALQHDNQVIALGGGTVMQGGARESIVNAENAKRIYLHVDANVLVQRIAADQTTTAQRPSLTGDQDAIAEVQRVLAEREPVYRAVADVTFNATHVNVADAVRHLLQHV